MFGKLSFCVSFMIPVTTLCIVMFAERQDQIFTGKTEFVTERKSLNVKVLIIKKKSETMASAKAHYSMYLSLTQYLLSHSGH